MNDEPEYVDVLPAGYHDGTLSVREQAALIRSGAIPGATVREALRLRLTIVFGMAAASLIVLTAFVYSLNR